MWYDLFIFITDDTRALQIFLVDEGDRVAGRRQTPRGYYFPSATTYYCLTCTYQQPHGYEHTLRSRPLSSCIRPPYPLLTLSSLSSAAVERFQRQAPPQKDAASAGASLLLYLGQLWRHEV